MSREHLFKVTIKDCKIQHFRAGGKGGQKQNKTNSGTRIIHEPSGAVGECREFASQLQNKRAAFRRMAESEAFNNWVRIEAAGRELTYHPSIDEVVDKMMEEENLIVEYYNSELSRKAKK